MLHPQRPSAVAAWMHFLHCANHYQHLINNGRGISSSSHQPPPQAAAPSPSADAGCGACARAADLTPADLGDQSDVALGQQRIAAPLLMDVCLVETELKRLTRWGQAPATTVPDVSPESAPNMQAIRCTASSCSCDRFQPGKGVHQARACHNCPHGWVAHALDKLHHLQTSPTKVHRNSSAPPPPTSGTGVTAGPFGGGGVSPSSSLQNPVELVSANLAFDVASLMLFGAQAIPIRLKILLDRLFSVLAHDDVLRVLHGFGWTYDDYARGYILQDPTGSVLDRWTLASRDEEPLILQQFLRFGETKAIAQRLLLQEPVPALGEEIQSAMTRFSSVESGGMRISNGPLNPSAEGEPKKTTERGRASAPLFKTHPSVTSISSSSPPAVVSNSSSPSSSVSTTATSNCRGIRQQPTSSLGSPSPTASPVPSASPVSVSPLNKLQNMQPCDFRRDRSSPSAAAARASENAATAHNRSPISSPTSSGNQSAHHHYPHQQNNSQLQPQPHPQPHHLSALASMHHQTLHVNNHSDLSGLSEDDMCYSDDDSQQDIGGAMNLSQGVSHLDSIFAARKVRHLRKSANPMRRRWNPMVLSTLTTNPSTGKKRVQCHVCLKTFCDKGALKIHFSAVHLREMHKCTVEGCNMMFSSRRSRNRHSANPNPKLHTPNFRRKINPHDGRTSHPYPLIPPTGLVGFGGPVPNNSLSLAPPTLDLERPFALAAAAVADTATAPRLALNCHPTGRGEGETPPRRQSPTALPEPPQQSSPSEIPDDSGALALMVPKKPRYYSDTTGDAELEASEGSRQEEGMNLSLKDAAQLREHEEHENRDHHQQQQQQQPREQQQVNNKGTRKRKNQHPTKCAAAAVESNEEDEEFGTTDDDSSSDTYIDQLDDDNGLLGSKSEDDDDDMGETSDDLLDDSKDGRLFAAAGAAAALLEKRLQERGARFSSSHSALQPIIKRDPSEEEEKENSVPGDGDKDRSSALYNGTTPPDLAENPLRHLESLSLGAFTNMVVSRNHHHHHLHSPGVGPPPPPRNSSGVSFHAPGLGLGSSSVSSPTAMGAGGEREQSITPGYISDPENSSTYGDGAQGLSLLPAFRDASMVGAVDIPVDKDNPRRCTACGKIFQNHFGVKTHYQNVHLKLMHKCTVEGCNAAFPSKRSRDRHSANLNLHRKLLSTTGDKQGSYMPHEKGGPPLHGYPFHPAAAAAAAVVRDEFFSRLYDPQSLPLNFAELYQGRIPGEGLVGFPGHLSSSPLGTLPFHPAFLPPAGHLSMNREPGRDSPTSSLTSPSPHSRTRSPLSNKGPFPVIRPVSRSRSPSPPFRQKSHPEGATVITLDEDLPPDSEGKFVCSFCSKKFHESVVLREHYEKAHTRELSRCSVGTCGKVFTSLAIRDHEKSHLVDRSGSLIDSRELEGASS